MTTTALLEPETADCTDANGTDIQDPTLGTNAPSPARQRRSCRRSCRTVSATLRPLSERMRSKVGRLYRTLGGQRGRLNDHHRALLAEAIFQIENDLEHRSPAHSQVVVLRTVRNRLYDDLGWNEYPTKP